MYKNKPMGLVEFFLNVLLNINPFNFPLLLAAFWYLFLHPEGKKYKIFGLVFILLFAVFLLNNGKPYYMSILFPLILAGGAAGTEALVNKYKLRKTALAGIVFLAAGYLFALPLSLPVLPVEQYIKYSQALGLVPESGERSRLGALPQYYADRYGWKELTTEIAAVYGKLTAEEKKNALIFTNNYGEAGAIEYFGGTYSLPPAISGHNNYYLWGYPSDRSGDVLIITGGNPEGHRRAYREVMKAGTHFHPYGMPYENMDIYICRGRKIPLSELWKHVKSYG
jgi:hypothetical protein